MAETATTRPARARKAATPRVAGTKTPAATKATPAKAAPKAATAATEDDERTRIPMVFEAQGDTKSYAVFTPPQGSGVVGKLYVPLGTEEVKVLLIGPASA